MLCNNALVIVIERKLNQMIRFADYVQSVGILRKTTNPILLVDGKHTVGTMLDISRILERLRHVNGEVVALIVTVKSDAVFKDIGYHAKHSAYLESFKGPVIGVIQGEFHCEPLEWPTPDSIVQCVPELIAQHKHPWLTDNWWHMQASVTTPPTIILQPQGKQHLDKHGAFPIVPVGQFEVKIRWQGSEVYVGDFKEGAKHGKGIFVRSNGDKHIGFYQGGISHGKGVYHWKNGNMWVGEWLHGRQGMRGELRTAQMQSAALLLQCNLRISQARQELDALAKKDEKHKLLYSERASDAAVE